MTTGATLSTFRWNSRVLGRTKQLSALLPPGHDSTLAYPTLYLLHGYGGNRDTWMRHTDLQSLVAPLGIIVVMPETGRRWLINDARGNRYEDYLLEEVIPFAEHTLGSSPHRAGRALAGFSMGGATALMHALRRPDLFCAAASLAGAVEAASRLGDPYAELRLDPQMLLPVEADHTRTWGPPDSDTRVAYDLFRLITEPAAAPLPELYIDVGSDDHPRILTGNRRLHDTLDEAGQEHAYTERSGAHTWAYICAALPGMLRFVAGCLTPGVVGLPGAERRLESSTATPR